MYSEFMCVSGIHKMMHEVEIFLDYFKIGLMESLPYAAKRSTPADLILKIHFLLVDIMYVFSALM